jgi:hypothetical protein
VMTGATNSFSGYCGHLGFCFFFFSVLGFELRAMPPALFWNVFFQDRVSELFSVAGFKSRSS